MKCYKTLTFLGLICFCQTAAADTQFKDLPAAEREKVIRESLFAVDNPERVAAATIPDPAVPQYSGQQTRPSQRRPMRQDVRQEQYLQQQYLQQQYQQQQQQPGEPEPAIAVDENGSVRVRSGNASVDQSIESYLRRKAQSARNAIRNFWR